ncbi:hypothetical protein [Sciscionella marina]|uniref:hypothetical protein n=1 Tax=Sciscionella marina TaxID=508770 RepID=UPI00059065D1|nr:hypothetical protein [Sciscionella marina]
MESNRDAEEAPRQADRAAAAPYVDYPPTPAWYPPATGLWAAAFCLVTGIPSGSALKAVALAVLVVAELGFVVWYRRYRGVLPRGRAPKEVRKVLAAFVVGAVVVIAVIGVTLWLTTPLLAAILAAAVVIPAIAWYERAYAAAAGRTRARLA